MRIAAVVLGFVLGSFELWRGLREEYEGESILTLSLVLVAGGLAGAFLGVWGTSFGVLGAWLWWSLKYKVNFWEGLDIIGPAGLNVGVVVTLGFGEWKTAAAFAVGSLLSFWLKRHYRGFKWYKSGRAGLVGVWAVLWLAILEMAVATRTRNGLYWVGLEVSQWIGIWVAVFSLITVYLRAGYKIWPKAIKKP